MKLRVDHVFILTGAGAPAADKLVSYGLAESFGRVHKGQGTSNRRFEFSNSMLELLWVHDEQEAMTGSGAMLHLAERVAGIGDNACPFGIILSPSNGNDRDLPFTGWSYQPDYFEPPMAFHIGSDSEQLSEPLCVYAPFFKATPKQKQLPEQSPSPPGGFGQVTQIRLTVASDVLSDQLAAVSGAPGLQISTGTEHLMELSFDHSRQGISADFRPDLPLIINR